ncbi:MAG: hypothetical protein RSA66_09170, partial [Muribaculaceae bacterium]
MKIDDNNFEEILASYIDGTATEDQTAQINELMSHDLALFMDVILATKATCMVEISANVKEKDEQLIKQEETQIWRQHGHVNHTNKKHTNFAEAVEYTERHKGVVEKYPEIKFQRFFPEVLNRSKLKSFPNVWAFGLPFTTVIFLLLLEQILRNLRLYKSYYFDTIMIILLCASVISIVVLIVLHFNKVSKKVCELEPDIDYIENKNKRFVRIVKNGKFGLLDTYKYYIS